MSAKLPPPPPLTPEEIEACSVRLRERLGVGLAPHFNIVVVVENVLPTFVPDFQLEVLSKQRMFGIDAYADFKPPRLLLREDVYEGAHQGDVRSRYSIAHELGHIFLHPGHPRPRVTKGVNVGRRRPDEWRLEREADQFACAFLMPEPVALAIQNAHLLAGRCGASGVAAKKRLHDLLLRKQHSTPAAFEDEFKTIFNVSASLKAPDPTEFDD